MHLLPNVSIRKDNQVIKFSNLIDYNARNIFFKYNAKNEAGRQVADLFVFFKKRYIR